MEFTPLDIRIYCVVAKTVQCPLAFSTPTIANKNSYPHPTLSTRNIVQPAGRQVAQACHAVSRAKLDMVADLAKRNPPDFELIKSVGEPTTTIVLECRDSYELWHAWMLCQDKDIPTSAFYDTQQPDYGDLSVMIFTAFATHRVFPGTITGVLDYLPLWSAQ